MALICPWASRTLIGRALKGLGGVISVSIVEPELMTQGRRFPHDSDPVAGAAYMHEIYTQADPAFTGRATVPVLFDKLTRTIVSNESADILRTLNLGFGELASGPDRYPEDRRTEIDALNDRIYPRLNNGVYRAGFATTQVAYGEAFDEVFAQLDELEERLSDGRPFLFGEWLTETDIRLFVTLVRFDVACLGLFKCNLRILDYPHLQGYLLRMLDLPGVSGTVSLDHIKRGYYSIRALNPTGIVPKGPKLEWLPGVERLRCCSPSLSPVSPCQRGRAAKDRVGRVT